LDFGSKDKRFLDCDRDFQVALAANVIVCDGDGTLASCAPLFIALQNVAGKLVTQHRRGGSVRATPLLFQLLQSEQRFDNFLHGSRTMQLACRMEASRLQKRKPTGFCAKIERDAVPWDGLTSDSASFALIFVKECSNIFIRLCTQITTKAQNLHQTAVEHQPEFSLGRNGGKNRGNLA